MASFDHDTIYLHVKSAEAGSQKYCWVLLDLEFRANELEEHSNAFTRAGNNRVMNVHHYYNF
eukprot:4579392-Amphidinium_carterae.2